MNAWLMSAAGVTMATFLLHTLAGGKEVAAPLLKAQDLGPVEKYTSYYCWHMVTILLLVMALAIGYIAWQPNLPMLLLLLCLSLAFTSLSLLMAKVSRLGIWALPQWVCFAAISGLLLAGWARG
ncbi:hypothetical protein [Chitinivorax sp. B]|uniref:hypothetical protein n=1 Tax=Chitinivorax sp. B TaxID=2502235 RepID=UPI0010F8FA8A|nr:hypothetical protein [Chitinivorax sp. B]